MSISDPQIGPTPMSALDAIKAFASTASVGVTVRGPPAQRALHLPHAPLH